MKVISIREHPEYVESAIEYFQNNWATVKSMMIYDDSIRHSIDTESKLPHWYVLLDDDEEIVGCAGLITNDFISRMDLYPWICALHIDNEYRGNRYSELLIDRCKEDAKKNGFQNVYLCTDHIGFYEKYRFEYFGRGYHPWGESSRIYSIGL